MTLVLSMEQQNNFMWHIVSFTDIIQQISYNKKKNNKNKNTFFHRKLGNRD
jgi:hypothetical protein